MPVRVNISGDNLFFDVNFRKMYLMYIESVAFICLPLCLMTELSLTRDFELLDFAESGSYILIEETHGWLRGRQKLMQWRRFEW